ncbi:trem-like transcript 2 protein [Tupaia chinensis]|uniref:trem-like transcript 2 protein n=1 Tax=Tupaia chinensis TaxID=246437 RepID=UPI000703CA98|nr:trem-like transcript 2 protein [Tupaia chinensis]
MSNIQEGLGFEHSKVVSTTNNQYGDVLRLERRLDGGLAPSLLLLLLVLLWPQGCLPGAPAENVYTKVRHLEGETLSVQCSYKGRKNPVDGKVWCKIRRKRCDVGFTRIWVQGPRYVLQDDVKAKVVNITMRALTRQDSGRYWCMRNSSGILYPLMGFQLEVSPASTTKRSNPLTHLANILRSGIAVTAGQAPTFCPEAPFTTGTTVFTPGLLTLARLLPSTALGATRPTSVTRYSFTGTGATTTAGSRRTIRSHSVTASPSHARASSPGLDFNPTRSRHLSSSSPATRMCLTSRSPLNNLPSTRQLHPYVTVLVVVLTILPVPVLLILVYGFWKKRHRGSYNVCGDPARSWRKLPGRPEPPWKPAWSEAT